jgi:hypothetical protein
MMTFKAFLIILFFLICYSAQGMSMPIFSHPPEEVVIFSPMQGQITHNGKPVANAKITRWLKWKDPEGETEIFYTDENGYFELPIKTDVVTLGKFTTFVMHQEINVLHNDEKFPIWVMGKSSKEKFGELGGVPTNLHCELANDISRVEVENGLLGTTCTWTLIKDDSNE